MHNVVRFGQIDVSWRVCVGEDLSGYHGVRLHIEHANAWGTVDENVLWEAFFVIGGETDVVEGGVDEGESGEKHRHYDDNAGIHLEKIKMKIQLKKSFRFNFNLKLQLRFTELQLHNLH